MNRHAAGRGVRGHLRALVGGGLVLIAATATAAAEPAAESCDAVRAKIGRLPPADAGLLRTLAARLEECRFTPAEVYRAAHGDKPMAAFQPDRSQRESEDEEDDD